MTLIRIDESDPVARIFGPDGEVVYEAMPAPEYVVSYGCGQGMIFAADGRVLHYDDHVPGCEHEEPES